MIAIADSILIIVDIQEKLTAVMFDNGILVKNTVILARTANYLNIPIFCTEQVPDKLGPTIPMVASNLKTNAIIPKVDFSICRVPAFQAHLVSFSKKQIIVAGIEAHVCIYQSVSDLISKGYSVQVVTDAVTSRCPNNKKLALTRMQLMGANLTSTEMIVFEWLKTAGHEKFRQIAQLIK